MKQALVTGGCGFLGSSIVRELLDRSVSVRVLALPDEPTENVDGFDVEVVRGNVLSINDVKEAVAGMDTVFHAAAVYKDWMPDPTPMYDVNLRGTFNVLEAARRTGAERVVYTASIASIGRPERGNVGDENTPYDGWDIDFAYGRSKYHSRVLAEDFAAWGLDVRVICPGIVLGPGDIGPTPSGKLLINAVKLGTGLYTEGGANYVDVRDAARVHVLAALKGRAAERYLATAYNLSNRELLEAVSRATEVEMRLVKLPYRLARGVIRAANRRAASRGIEPPIAAAMFEYSKKPSYYTNDKAVSELGAEFRPIEETLRDAIEYFRRRGEL